MQARLFDENGCSFNAGVVGGRLGINGLQNSTQPVPVELLGSDLLAREEELWRID